MYYEITARRIRTDKRDYESFGIRAVKGGGTLCELRDVSEDFTAVDSLVKLMNNEKAELCHFPEIVEDFIFCPIDYIV